MPIPSYKDLEWIISWPKNTSGYSQEEQALYTLLALCHQLGFGRLPQMAEWIQLEWRASDGHEESIIELKKLKEALTIRTKELEAYRKDPAQWEKDVMEGKI